MSTLFVVLAIIAAWIAGIFTGIAKMMSDAVIHNRVMATYDPVGIQKFLRLHPGMSACYGYLITYILLIFALMLQ